MRLGETIAVIARSEATKQSSWPQDVRRDGSEST
jgi:hypothetical protein